MIRRQTIKLYLTGKPPVEVEAKVFGGVLAIHRSLVKRYTISHVPTGMQIFDGMLHKAAERCVDFLLKDGIKVWQFGVFGEVPPAKDRLSALKLRNLARDMDWSTK